MTKQWGKHSIFMEKRLYLGGAGVHHPAHRKVSSSPADFTNTIASSPTRARNDGRSPCCLASFFSGTAVASAMSRCTPSGSPSFSTSILAAEQCSRTLIKKLRRPVVPACEFSAVEGNTLHQRNQNRHPNPTVSVFAANPLKAGPF